MAKNSNTPTVQTDTASPAPAKNEVVFEQARPHGLLKITESLPGDFPLVREAFRAYPVEDKGSVSLTLTLANGGSFTLVRDGDTWKATITKADKTTEVIERECKLGGVQSKKGKDGKAVETVNAKLSFAAAAVYMLAKLTGKVHVASERTPGLRTQLDDAIHAKNWAEVERIQGLIDAEIAKREADKAAAKLAAAAAAASPTQDMPEVSKEKLAADLEQLKADAARDAHESEVLVHLAEQAVANAA